MRFRMIRRARKTRDEITKGLRQSLPQKLTVWVGGWRWKPSKRWRGRKKCKRKRRCISTQIQGTRKLGSSISSRKEGSSGAKTSACLCVVYLWYLPHHAYITIVRSLYLQYFRYNIRLYTSLIASRAMGNRWIVSIERLEINGETSETKGVLKWRLSKFNPALNPQYQIGNKSKCKENIFTNWMLREFCEKSTSIWLHTISWQVETSPSSKDSKDTYRQWQKDSNILSSMSFTIYPLSNKRIYAVLNFQKMNFPIGYRLCSEVYWDKNIVTLITNCT